MKDLQTLFIDDSKLRKLLPSNSHILIAISGGMDSVVLTHLLREISSQCKYKMTLAHINHGLRANANKDMKFVCNLAKDWDIPCETIQLNPKIKNTNESVEAWAREHRYAALEKIRDKVQADFICTAHHKSDQAETILMRLALGTGGKGMKGIRRKVGFIRRPLLQITKTELIDYTQEHGLSFIEDETNKDVTIPRNFIRHNILSPWKKQYDHVEDGIFKTSSHIIELVDAVSFSVDYFYNRFIHIENGSKDIILIKNEIKSIPTLIQLHLIKKCIGFEKIQWRQHDWNSLKSFLDNSETGNILGFGSDWKILNNRSEWIVFKSEDKPKSSYTVFPNGTSYCGDHVINWEWYSQPFTIKNRDPNSEFIDGSVIENRRLQLRLWNNGDRFQPLGMSGWKKVSDFLIDKKVNLHQKSNQMVFTADNEIVWVCGHRISDWVKVTTKTIKPAKITLGLNR